ncbi:MAG: AsnC family protein [Actinophytocola sp.]|nr:AsnC family protein [Actinophytocola sp.]
MSVTDPNDARLLAALAEQGKAAVHELAARLGMDPRDVAYRLVTLSGSGLPLLVGVECDAQALRAALAGGHAQPGPPSGGHPAHGTPSGPVPHQQHGWYPQGPAASGPYAVPPSGAYPAPPAGPNPAHGTPSGPYAPPGTPSGAYPVSGAPSGPYPSPGAASGPYAMQGASAAPSPSASGPHASAPHSPTPADPVLSTWGPPQTASWARGDQPPAAPATTVTAQHTGRIGDALQTQGLDGDQLRLQLLEVQDPADYLFSAAGYQLNEGERAIVVHTEITNTGQTPFASLPDNYLELLTEDDTPIGKAAVSLTSRPPHRIGVQPGETLGGHTVYVLPEATIVRTVRWSPRPEPDERTVTWTLDD